MSDRIAYGRTELPAGLRTRRIANVNGLDMHFLEAGFETPHRPCVLLLHGFPELAYSWRKVMVPIASQGFRVLAPDQRGYGRTTGWDDAYDGDLGSFAMLNLARDALAFVSALGLRRVAAVVGHDFGSPVAAYCALIRPDVFGSVVLMSAPFAGPPPVRRAERPAPGHSGAAIDEALAALDPPRKHYQWYYSTREADADMRDAPDGIRTFMRNYFHYKSADWEHNRPHPLRDWSAAELAKMPAYYIMDRDKGMADTVAEVRASVEKHHPCAWLTDEELSVYAREYTRNGFQGGLQWYRCQTGGINAAELGLFAGCTIDVPSSFIAGKSDWGTYQRPGDLERMQSDACTRMLGVHLVEGAGHWVQQEQPEAVSALLAEFLGESNRDARRART